MASHRSTEGRYSMFSESDLDTAIGIIFASLGGLIAWAVVILAVWYAVS
jgi:hypothetical protein